MNESRIIYVPADPEGIEKIETMMRAAEPYIVQPSNIPDHYALNDFVYASSFEDTEFRVLLDNNILTRAIALSKGYDLKESEGQREVFKLAAASMAYFLLGGFTIEPNIAIYEKASKSSHDSAVEELRYFRIADHINPQCYVDIALGRMDQIPKEEIEKATNSIPQEVRASNENDFTRTLDTWKYSYVFLLKVAVLWKEERPGIEKAEKFIEWMANEIYFSNVLSVFSLLLLAPNRLSKMIKGINSSDMQKLSEGIKNAAWDCTYLKYWLNLINNTSSNVICFLCSNDKVMKKIALSMLAGDIKTGDETLLEQFKEFWGEKDGSNINDKYKEQREIVSKDQEKRKSSVKDRLTKVNDMIEKLENELRINEI